MRRLATLGLVIAAAAFTAVGQLTITTSPALPTAIIGQPYPQLVLQTTADPGPLTWSFGEGNVPPNFLVVSPVSAFDLGGTFCYGPQACSSTAVASPPGVYKFIIQVSSQSTNQSASQQFTLVVENPPQILTKFLPDAVANQTYSTQLQGTGGTGNFTWSVLTGPLPPGISLADAANGVISGTAPGVNANYPIVVQLLDQVTQEKVTQALSITIVNGVAIITPSLPNATINQPYAFQLLGTPQINVVWSVPQSSQLPPGFSLSSDGVLTGTGVSLGAFNFQIQLVNVQFPTQIATRTFSFQVALGPLTIADSSLPAATLNLPYSFTLHGSGGIPPYTWSLSSSRSGVSIDPNTGIISGTPTQTGSFPFTVTLQDSSQTSVRQNYTLTVGNALTITNTSLPNGSLNMAYSATLTAAAGQTPYTWSISAGSLPPGLTLNTANGQISGAPTASGAYSFTAKATDSAGVTATKVFVITIIQPLTITTTSLPGGSLNQPYSQTLAATGGTQPVTVWTILSGSLPTGLTLNPSTGVISGTPTVAGSSLFTVQALDSAQGTASQTLTLTVAAPQPVTIVVPTTGTGSGQQPGITVTIPTPAAGDINGTLNLAFVSSVGGDDQTVRFAPSGSRSTTFTIPQGSTTAPNATVITGTVAGTITLTASVPGSPDVVTTIVIAPAVPVISSVVLQQVTGGLNVVVEGYSNTREVSSGSFTFTVSSGNTLSQAAINVPLTSAYTTWFTNTASNATGGQFKLTVPFSVTQGSAIAVTKVSVSLTNKQGASATVSSP